MKRLLGALSASALALGLASTAVAKEPVLLVHGFTSDASTWNTYAGWFARDGFDAYAGSYDWTRSNRTTAATIGGWTQSVKSMTGAGRIDIVGHSMGALNTRYYLKFLGGTSHVDDWMSVTGVNYGTTVANVFCSGGLLTEACADLSTNSSIIRDLNRGDDTPGSVNYGAAWSGCDIAVVPAWNARISGGRNYYIGCVGHTSALGNSSVYRTVRGHID